MGLREPVKRRSTLAARDADEPGREAPEPAGEPWRGGKDPEILDLRPQSPNLDLAHVRSRTDRARLRNAAWAFATRRVPAGVADGISLPVGKPETGDLVLARVDAIGHHRALQLINGRRRTLFPGDEIVVAYGHRYASSQFKSFVPESLGPCHLVAGGGIASRAVSWHAKIARGPTEITPLGLLVDNEGRRVNLRDFALEPVINPVPYAPTTLAVIGTSMDAGKTQTAAFLVRGLIAAGLRVGYAKITGTGAGGDTWLLRDAGADPVLDFVDAGLPSTFLCEPADVERVFTTLLGHLARDGVDAAVLEIADGVFQPETAALLKSAPFAQFTGGIVLAAQDSMGASAGFQWLRDQPVPVLALSGVLSAAPLQHADGLIYATLAVVLLQHAINLYNDAADWRLGAKSRPPYGPAPYRPWPIGGFVVLQA